MDINFQLNFNNININFGIKIFQWYHYINEISSNLYKNYKEILY